jgi:hypothetical protein
LIESWQVLEIQARKSDGDYGHTLGIMASVGVVLAWNSARQCLAKLSNEDRARKWRTEMAVTAPVETPAA